MVSHQGSQQTKTIIEQRERTSPFCYDKALLETIASNEGVFISDLPRDKLLQKKAVLFILNHTDDYDKDEQLKALDYLYMKKKEGIMNGKINT